MFAIQLQEATARGNVRRPAGTRQDSSHVRFEVPWYGLPDAGAAVNISTGKLSGILRKFPHGRKRGRRKAKGTAQPTRTVPALPMAVPALRMSVPVSGNLKRGDVGAIFRGAPHFL